MATVPNGVEILPKISTRRVGRTNVTDRQTTDGRAIAYSKRKLEFMFAKNINLTQQKQTDICNICTITQNKHQKLKPGLVASYDLWPETDLVFS